MQERAHDLLLNRRELLKRNKIFSFVPHEKQREFIEHDTVKRKAAIGGNQFGKTCIVVLEAYCHATGVRLYLNPSDPCFRVLMPSGEPIPVPNKGQMCGEDFPVGIGENLWPTWEEWIPRDTYEVIKHERGIPRTIRINIEDYPWADKTDPLYPYSIIHVHAYQQGRSSFQGVRVHWVIDDEPPPQPVYIEQMRGLIKHQGKWMGAMTCVEAAHTWIYDLFMPPELRSEDLDKFDNIGGYRTTSYYMVQGTMFDNLKNKNGSGGLTHDAIEEFRHDLGGDEDKIQVRLYGKPLHLTGTEYGPLWDKNVHVLKEHREPDPDLPHVCFCDPHPNKPFAILWFEVNEHNEWYCWCESYDEKLDDLDTIADEIKAIEKWKMNRNGEYVPGTSDFESLFRLIDPLGATHEKGIGMTMIQYFAINHSIIWEPWVKGDKAKRVRHVKKWLKPTKGPIGRPKLSFSPNCDWTIHQMPRYREKKPKDPTTIPNKGEMLDIDADLVQCVIAAVNSGYTYDMLQQIKEAKTGRVSSEVYGRGDTRSRANYGMSHTQPQKRAKWEEEFEDPWMMEARHASP